MYGDGNELEVMYSGFVADADADISVQGHRVRRHVDCDRECPALTQKIHDALHVHHTDETSIAAENTLRV